ncbi:MAG: M56 family metallopeptidase [Gemmatimonadales bacterium]
MRADPMLIAGSWLLTYLVHSTLLLAGVWLLSRRRTPAVRDMLWKAGMVGGLVTSALQTGLGLEPLGGLVTLGRSAAEMSPAPQTPAAGDTWAGQLVHEPAATPEAARAPAALHTARAEISRAAAPAPEPAAIATAPVRTSEPVTPEPSVAERYLPNLVWLWVIGGGVLMLLYLVRRQRAMRDIGPRRPVTVASLTAMLDTLRVSGGVRRPIHLTCAEGLGSPVALGASEIVLPEAALVELDAEQQRSMLAHELAHLARRDPTWLALACVIERVFFLQPLNRVARAGMQEAAELLCDDWAVHRTGSGFSLATCLVKVAEWVDTTPRPVPLAGMAEHRSQLVTRIHRLIEGRTMPSAPRSLWLATGAVTLLGITAVAAPGVAPARTPVQADSLTYDSEGLGAVSPESLAALEEQIAADTDSVIASDSGDRTRWSRLRAEVRALSRNVAGTARSRAYADRAMTAARAEMRAAALAPRAMSWSGPMPRPAVAPLAPHFSFSSDFRWGDRKRDTTGLAVPALIVALKDNDVEVRRAAAHSLSNYEDPRAVPGLIDALKDGDAEVREASAEALGSLEDKRAVTGLVALLKDGNKDVRRAALNALHSMPKDVPDEAILTAIGDSDPDVRSSAIGLALSRVEDNDEDTPIDSRYVSAFTRLLGDPQTETRQQAVEALAASHLKEAPAAMLALSRDKNADVRQSLANALGTIGDPKSVPTLKDLLNDSSADVRSSAVEALGSIRDRASLEALIGALKSNDAQVRRAAAEALGQRGE